MNKWSKENLEKCIIGSKTYKEIIQKIGLKVGASSYQTLKTYLVKYDIIFTNTYIKDKWIYDNLLKIVNESINHTEVLIKMELIPHGTNFKTLNNYLKKYDIDISHFESYFKNVNRGRVIKKTLSDVLIENSTYDRGSLKKRLYDEGLKERFCEICNQGEEWCGKKMSLILDHKNGINNDNRLENLQIVCPNCNATLDTYAGRNIESKKPKCECGNVISYKSKKCRICHSRYTRKIERPTIEQLNNEVSQSNYTEVGRKYGVSRATIRRWLNLRK